MISKILNNNKQYKMLERIELLFFFSLSPMPPNYSLPIRLRQNEESTSDELSSPGKQPDEAEDHSGRNPILMIGLGVLVDFIIVGLVIAFFCYTGGDKERGGGGSAAGSRVSKKGAKSSSKKSKKIKSSKKSTTSKSKK